MSESVGSVFHSLNLGMTLESTGIWEFMGCVSRLPVPRKKIGKNVNANNNYALAA